MSAKGQVLDGLRKLLEACTLEDLRASIEEHERLCASVCNDEMLERLAAEFRFPLPQLVGPEAANAPRAKRTTFYTNEVRLHLHLIFDTGLFFSGSCLVS